MSKLTRAEIDALRVEARARDRVCVKANDDGKCSQTHDPHHMIKQQVLWKYVADDDRERALRDVRGVVYICRLHHGRVESGMQRVEESILALTGFYDFLEEFDLTAIWEGILAKQLPTFRRLDV